VPRDGANRVEWHRNPGRIVGIGQEDDARSRSNRREDPVEREREIGPRHHLNGMAADGLGINAKDFECRFGDERFRNRATHWRPQIRHCETHDPFVKAVGQREAVRIDAQVLSARPRRGRVWRVEPHFVGPQLRERLEHARRAAAGVLVLMKPQPVIELRRLVVSGHDCRALGSGLSALAMPEA
jgi:hypothetical protein